MKKILVIIWFIIPLTGLSGQNLAPNINQYEFIAYLSINNDNQNKIISQTNDGIRVFDIPDDKCVDISDDARFVLLYERGGNTTQIIHLLSHKVVDVTTWAGKSFECHSLWLSDNRILILKDLDSPYYQFAFDGFSLVELPDLDTSTSVIYLQLPNWINSKYDSRIWRSPNPDIISYEYCYSGESIDDIRCNSPTDIAIYDLSQNSIITILDANPDYMRGYRFRYYYPNEVESVTNGLLSWSYDARYLAFGDCEETNTRWLVNCITQVYDLYTDTYIEVPFGALPNIWRRLEWSPNDYLLGIWSAGKQDDDAGYPYDNLTIFTFANINTGTTIMSQRSFDAPNQRIIGLSHK